MRNSLMILTAVLYLVACQHEPTARDTTRYGNVNQEALEAYHTELDTERLTRTRTRNIWLDGRRYRLRESVPDEQRNKSDDE